VICTLTARRLKPGSHEDFRSAWGGGSSEGERPEGTERWRQVYHCRDVDNENVVVSFGFFDGTLEELREAQGNVGRDAQVSSIEPLVEETLLDGAYEVVEELTS
jgi:hypothetical protein